jgi:transposase
MAEQPSRREQAIALRNAGHSTSQIRKAMGLRSGGGALRRWLKDVPPPEWTKRPNAKDDLREKAIALRREGYSYREIREQVPVSKSSLSLWLRDIDLTEEHRERLARLKVEGSNKAGKTNQARRIAREQHNLKRAAAQIPSLAESELFVAGLVAYWAEGAKTKPWRRQNSVSFINSDAEMIRLFLSWLRLVAVPPDDLVYYLSIHESADLDAAHAFWTSVVASSPEQWRRPVLKRHKAKTTRKNVGDEYHGCLVVYVRRSTELYQKIEGWWRGVTQALDSLPKQEPSGVV